MGWILAILGALVTGGGTAVFMRPAARARRRARRAMRRVEQEQRSIARVSSAAEDRLSEAAATYARHAAEERLGTIPVDELRSFGAEKVRWGVLHEDGVHTAADVRGLTRAALLRMDGVGPVSARRILRARKKLFETNREEPVSPPGVGASARPAVATIRAAHDVLAARNALAGFPGRLEEHRSGLGERFRKVRRGTSVWRGWSGDEEALAEADAIVREVRELEEEDALLGRARIARERARKGLARRVPPDELERDHDTRFADYCALIERALPGRRFHRGGGVRGGLPDEIAARVEEFPLQTSGLRLTLRGYQEFGAKFLLAQERTLLGDEMGLGKTIEALAVLAHLQEVEGARRFLVVSPASVLHNWAREVRRWTDLDVHVLHGDEKEERFAGWLDAGGVGVTSFRTLQSLPAEADEFARVVDALIVDEAHYVKNPRAERTKTVAEVAEDARFVAFLTGTPLENRLLEFQRLVSLLQPAVATKLGGSLSATGDLVLGRHAFQEAVAPVYLRRNQEDVLRELPERIDKEEWVQLSPAETAAYREAVEARDIMGMRRAATIATGARGSAKLGRLEELIDEYRESARKVLVFSFFLDVLAAVEERFETLGKITGSVASEERLELCDALEAREGHSILLAQIQAGGVGLNLQAASVVVLLEPQWKPSTEEQAIARAHRMGQTRAVLVHRFLTADSVDERMLEVLGEKQELFDTFARGSVIKDASSEATEASLTRRVIDAEVARLGSQPLSSRTD